MKAKNTLASLTIALLCLAETVARASPPDAGAEKSQIDRQLTADYPHLEALYRSIHSHPELGFQEVRTAALLAQEMRKLGFQVTEKVGRTGIVAIYHNGPGPTVMVRTELDALPLKELTGLPYASEAKGVYGGKDTFITHACGHDIHMAWWVGTAQALLAMKSQWSGTLMFIGQPAEELGQGAKAMLDDGLFTRFPKPDYAFAAHVGPSVANTLFLKSGTVTSAADAVEITFKGRGAHGSAPAESIDPIVIGAHFVTDVQTVISREKDPSAFGVITVGSFQAGDAGNVIPSEALLRLTLRSYSPEVRSLLLAGVQRTAKAVADMAKAPVKAALGDNLIILPSPISASEDFSEYAVKVPSVFFLVGGSDPKMLADSQAKGVAIPVNHSPYFAPVPEPSIKTGVVALTLAVLTVAAPGSGESSTRGGVK
jgi:amidohydrolase